MFEPGRSLEMGFRRQAVWREGRKEELGEREEVGGEEVWEIGRCVQLGGNVG